MSAEEDHTETPKGEETAEEDTHESTATFEPVVRLEEVETMTGEENEDAVCTYRAKLFVYGETLLNKGTGNKEWKERGVGEIKVLRHKDHGRLRVLMRQDKTMKVIANHPLDPIINLQPNVGSDRSWLWTTDDYSEGEYVETTFACRFQDTDKANEFKEQFLALQKEMETILQGKDKPGDDASATAADEVAQALSALKTGEDAEEDDDDDDVDV